MKLSAVFAIFSTTALVACFPARSYSVVNVDGQGNNMVAAQPTATPDSPAAVVTPTPAAAVTPSSVQAVGTPVAVVGTPVTTVEVISTVTISTTPTATPVAQFVTVTVTPTPTSTEYYDDGMWHTKYPKKPEATAAAARGNSTVVIRRARRAPYKLAD